MNTDLCNVCGSSGTNLVDGFYYCIECGTQNQNVQETVVELTKTADGTIAIGSKKRIFKVKEKAIEMSGEWYKWHAFNFILFGLAEQLVECGANPTFKSKLLWIWVRYMKKYQNKSELGKTHESQDDGNPSMFIEEENEESGSEDELPGDSAKMQRANKRKRENIMKDLHIVSKGLLLTMLYLALNLDKSHIQLTHLYRFVRENRLNMRKVLKFVPKDILVKNIPHWYHFKTSKVFPQHWTRAVGCSLLVILDLGSPILPDLRGIVDNLLTELCLPNDLKLLVHSLMHFRSCKFLQIDIKKLNPKGIPRIPDYECVILSYVIVALKMCFGIDGVYEQRLSDVVDKTNEKNGFPKSYKYGKYSNPTERLFSWRDWCSYLVFRKIMLCKHCLYMAEQHSLDVDDYVNMEHMEERTQGKKTLTDEIAMDLLKKIPLDNNISVIPKSEFIPSCVPMALYTEIIKEHCQDPEVKQLLSEDFTQYSLKYAIENLSLIDIDSNKNIIKGVTEENKINHKKRLSRLMYGAKKGKVYVKFCENKNWLYTNRPTIEHVTGEEPHEVNGVKNKDIDHGCSSECAPNDKDCVSESQKRKDTGCTTENETDRNNPTEPADINNIADLEEERTCGSNFEDNYENQKIIREEDEGKNIFDDSFEYLDVEKEENTEDNDCAIQNKAVEQVPNECLQSDSDNINDSDSDMSCTSFNNFNPATFNREATIRELLLLACHKYKCRLPKEYRPKGLSVKPYKRIPKIGTFVVIKNMNPSGSKKEVEQILDFYTDHVQGDLLNKLQQQVNLAIRNANKTEQLPDNSNTIVEQTDVNEVHDITENIMDDVSSINTLTNADQALNPDQQEEINENLEHKLFENEQMELDDLMPKSDAKFDEKKYKVDQLYIKINPRGVEEVIESIEKDPELEEILRMNVNKDLRGVRLSTIKKRQREPSDSDEELPLCEVRKKVKLHKKILKQEARLQPLVRRARIFRTNYWCRHYDTFKDPTQKDKFDQLLEDNVCFLFIIRECASVLDCSVYELYKHTQRIEEFMKNYKPSK